MKTNIVIITTALIILDFVTKLVARTYPYFTYLIDNRFGIYVTFNSGAALGFFQERAIFFAFASIIVFVMFLVYAVEVVWEYDVGQFGAGLVFASILGNSIDRIFYRESVDFLVFKVSETLGVVLNFADAYAVVGNIILVLTFIYHIRKVANERQ